MGTQLDLNNYFESYLKKEPLFRNKKVLQINYTPDDIPHRVNQINSLAAVLAPTLRKEKPSNVFIYGKTGTGKTLVDQHILEKLLEMARNKQIPLKTIYLNCKLKKIADTEYRLIAELAKAMGREVPPTGLPTDEVYNIFIKIIDQKEQILVLVLDEIDRLVEKTGDEILYNLTRLNSHLQKAEISFIGISNDVRFIENIDPRVKSSLSEEELIFPPYNAEELRDILKKRSTIAFKEGAVLDGVLEKCAAYAAREHGDARRALDLLRVAGEVAERSDADKVTQEHIDKAEERIEKDRVLEIIITQPKQSQCVFYAILLKLENTDQKIETGEVYETYKDICIQTGLAPLTQRRVSDLLSELDMLGLINGKVISKGRYGRTREIYLTIPKDILDKIKTKLKEELL